MQSKLEMSPASRHHRLSPPRLNLRRSKSYQHEKAPLSATTSRFSFNHLFFSPPPSPSLPALVPRAKKSPARTRPTRVFRLVAWAVGTVFIVYLTAQVVRRHVDLGAVKMAYVAPEREEFEMVSQEGLPDFPTPIMVKDALGRSSWTVSIPRDHEFPLGVREYDEIMASCQEVATAVRDSRTWTKKGDQLLGIGTTYGATDPNYVDVRRAEKEGLLPSPAADGKNEKRKSSQGNLVSASSDPSAPECGTSLTVVLETSDAGLGATLMLLWTFYGVAKEQGRAFFVDDSRWAYGGYTSMFQAPPVPECRPPPRHEMVPCPSQAEHLVVSAATAKHVLVDALASSGSDARLDDPQAARKTLFDFARRGYEDLFHVVKEDADYVERRVGDLGKKALEAGTKGEKVPVAGMHIRRGDCSPLEFPYRNSYIPNDVYTDSAVAAVASSSPGRSDPLLVVASDDPTIHNAEEFHGAHHAQERIKLASKEPSEAKQRNPHVFHRFKDEGFGWEGGFFSAMFWNLGLPRGSGGSFEDARDAGDETVRLRSYLGRAYVLDLAVLARAGDVVVCGVGSMGCRLLGVMMGWEAVEGGSWVNVDGEHGWMGLTW